MEKFNQKQNFLNGIYDYTEQDEISDRWEHMKRNQSAKLDIKGSDGPLLKHILIALALLAAAILLPYIL